MRYETALAAALVLGLGLSLSACGEDKQSADQPAASETEHNEADVEFAQNMLPHHAQALAMVDMTRGRAGPGRPGAGRRHPHPWVTRCRGR